jgi:dTMP kinase
MAREGRAGPRMPRAGFMARAIAARSSAAPGSAVQAIGASSPRPWPGWFIAIEGGDGVGKSTQIVALAKWLRDRGYDVVTTREPGGTELGEKLREILLHAREQSPLGARAEALLFAADRADHIEKVVRPALERGAIVLTDRHVDSSIAYQSGGRGLAADQVAALSQFATDGVRPDVTVLLDLDPSTARLRAQARPDGPDKVEAESAEFHARVRAVFRALAAAEPYRYLVLAAADPANVITAMIQDRLEHTLPLSPREAAKETEKAEARRAAIEAEREVQEAQAAAERAAKQRRADTERAAREAARQAERDRRADAAQAQADLVEAERARLERESREREQRAETDRQAERLRAEERDRQAAADAKRRHEAELTVRQIEAKAKERAREQAQEHLAASAASQARTARLVQLATASSDPARPTDPGAGGQEPGEIDQTRELPVTLADDLLGVGEAVEPEPERGRWWRGKG